MSTKEMQSSEEKIELTLSSVGAKIAGAGAMSLKVYKLLIEAQGEVSDLYISLGELLEKDKSSYA